jgi:hypothetical protein
VHVNYPQQLSSVAAVTCSQLLFAVFAGLLHLRVLHSSASSHFSRPFLASFRIFLLLFSSDEPINIRLGHLLSPMHNKLPYRFNTLFSILSRTVCYSRLFLITSFLTLKFRMFLQLFSKRSFLYLTAFSSICNPLSKLISGSLKFFLSLCRIFLQLYSIK